MSAIVFHNCWSFHKKIVAIVRVCDGNPVSFTIITNFHCDNCEILKIVAMFLWNIATFVTAWLCKCNWINLWSIGLLRFYLMWTTNHIAGLNERSANEPIHPDYGRQFQARHKFRSRRFFNYTRCSALVLYKSNWEKSRITASYFVYPAFWLTRNVLLLYSGKALCNGLTTIFWQRF